MKTNLIEYVLKVTGQNQSELAKTMNVSRGQITKWKNGADYIPSEREKQLAELAGLDPGVEPDWCLFAPTDKLRQAWIACVQAATECSEVPIEMLDDMVKLDADHFVPMFLLFLRDEATLTLPDQPPSPDEYFSDEIPPFQSVLVEFLENYGCLAEWVETFLRSDEINTACDDESGYLSYDLSLEMAVVWINDSLLIEAGASPDGLAQFKHKAKSKAFETIQSICRAMQLKGIPFEIDYFNFVNSHPAELLDEILFRRSSRMIQTVESILPYGQRRMLQLMQENQNALNNIAQSLAVLSEKLGGLTTSPEQ